MKISNVSFNKFCDSFGDSHKNNFTYAGKRALFDYIENLEDETGEELELDTVALCCDYSEYENLEELQKNYTDIKNMEDLEDHTTVIKIPNSDSLIIQQF